MKCAKCDHEAVKKIVTKDGFIPVCDTGCGIIVEFELILNRMKDEQAKIQQ